MMANEMTRWNPFREMANMQSTFDRFFEDWQPFSNNWRQLAGEGMNSNLLAIDAHEDDKQYTVITELPGVKPENINVRQDGDYLLIEANFQEENNQQDEQNKRWLVRERRSGNFSRRIRLPQNVDFAKADANYHDGVLTLTLPKMEAAQPRQIQVKSGNGNGSSNGNSNGGNSTPNTVVGSTAGKNKNTNTVTGKAAETSTKE
jgi:HSP20 family protein